MVQLAVSVQRLSTLAAAALLSACALQTPPAHEQIVRDALPATTTVPLAWKSASDSASVESGWLEALADPTLQALVEEAWSNNRDLLQAAERVRIAQQWVIVAGAQLQPQVGAVLGGRSTRDQDHDGSCANDYPDGS